MADKDTGTPPRVMIVIAAVLTAVLAVVAAVLGLSAYYTPDIPTTGPLPLVGVPAPQAATPQCATLIGAVPAGLTSAGVVLGRRELAAPAPAATAAWGGGDPVVLRCGLDKPLELTDTAQLRVINGVQWLQVPGDGAATWYVVDREVYAALTVPGNAGTGPLQEISTVVGATLTPRPVRF